MIRAYEDTRDQLFRYLVHLGLSSYVAQEITHDCFLRLHTSLLDGKPIQHIRAWLFTVGHNLAVNWLRQVELERTSGAGAPGISESPELNVLGEERLLRLQQAVANLSIQQQRCLHLRAEGLRYREIAEILGIEISTVAEFLRRAVAQLRRMLYE